MVRRIGSVLLKAFLALCVVGLLLGVLLPVLSGRGIAPPQWLVLGIAAIFLALVLWRDVRGLRAPK